MSATALQISRLLSTDDDKVRMRRRPFSSKFDGSTAPLISRAILFIPLFLHLHILHIILPCRKGRRILEHLQDVLL